MTWTEQRLRDLLSKCVGDGYLDSDLVQHVVDELDRARGALHRVKVIADKQSLVASGRSRTGWREVAEEARRGLGEL